MTDEQKQLIEELFKYNTEIQSILYKLQEGLIGMDNIKNQWILKARVWRVNKLIDCLYKDNE